MTRKAGPFSGLGFFRYIFLLHTLTILFMFALAAAYVIHVFRNDRLPSDRRKGTFQRGQDVGWVLTEERHSSMEARMPLAMSRNASSRLRHMVTGLASVGSA